MDLKKVVVVVKKVAHGMTIVMGAVTLFIGVIGAFIVIPPFISLPLVAAIGLIYASLAAKNESQEYDKRQLQLAAKFDKDKLAISRDLHEIKLDLDEINKVAAENKISSVDDVKSIFAKLNIKPSSAISIFEDEEKTTIVNRSHKHPSGGIKFHFKKPSDETLINKVAANSPDFNSRERIGLKR